MATDGNDRVILLQQANLSAGIEKTNCTPSSNSSVENQDMLILAKIIPILVPILFSMIIIIGFVGNILVVCVVTQNKTMRNTTNLLILNLAVSIKKTTTEKEALIMISNSNAHFHGISLN